MHVSLSRARHPEVVHLTVSPSHSGRTEIRRNLLRDEPVAVGGHGHSSRSLSATVNASPHPRAREAPGALCSVTLHPACTQSPGDPLLGDTGCLFQVLLCQLFPLMVPPLLLPLPSSVGAGGALPVTTLPGTLSHHNHTAPSRPVSESTVLPLWALRPPP